MATRRPTSRTEHIPHIVKTRGAVKEANERWARDEARRRASPTLLSPADIRGQYDASRLLLTTLGGELRPITPEDLRAFKRNIDAVGRAYKKGLTAQQIINTSRPIDRDRANAQIHYAVPSSANRGQIRFITNAGPDSEVTRHYVVINIMNYATEAVVPEEPKAIAARMVKESPLQIWCDCGRFRYFYAYVATIGGLNAGRAETAFPKIRNPTLTGLACKHILRTLHDFQRSMSIRNVIIRMIERTQRDDHRHERISEAEAKKIAKNQTRSQREIRVVSPATKALRSAVAKKWAKKPPKKVSDAEQARFDAERNLRKLKQLGAISDEDFKKILSTLKKKG